MPFQVNFGLASSGSGQSASPDHNSPRRDKADGEISDLGFFPLRSPLLRESLLVSLPPLIDMLKFSGWVSLDLRPQKKLPPHRCKRTLAGQNVSHSKPCGLPSASRAENLAPWKATPKEHNGSHTRSTRVTTGWCRLPRVLNVAIQM